jgi:hypothetical protein
MIMETPSAVLFSQRHRRHAFGDPLKHGPVRRPVETRAFRYDRRGVEFEQAQQAQAALEARVASIAQFAHHLARCGVAIPPSARVDLGRIAMAAQAHVVFAAKAFGHGWGLTIGKRASHIPALTNRLAKYSLMSRGCGTLR